MNSEGSELNSSLGLRKLILIAAFVLVQTSAETVETTAKGRKTLTNIVEAGTNTATNSQICIFKNEVNSWCFNQLTPLAKVGWDFKQVFGKDTTAVASAPIYYSGTPFQPTYYRISFRPYIDL
jgi:hypothetical protein